MTTVSDKFSNVYDQSVLLKQQKTIRLMIRNGIPKKKNNNNNNKYDEE